MKDLTQEELAELAEKNRLKAEKEAHLLEELGPEDYTDFLLELEENEGIPWGFDDDVPGQIFLDFLDE